MNDTPVERGEIIDALEGRYIQGKNLKWYHVKDHMIQTEYGPADLLYEEMGTLEIYLRDSHIKCGHCNAHGGPCYCCRGKGHVSPPIYDEWFAAQQRALQWAYGD